jgi:hypothetical protein
MRGFTTFILILSGTMFSGFIFIVALYAVVPEFRNYLTGSISGDSDIPVVSNVNTTAELLQEETVDLGTEEEIALSPMISTYPVKEQEAEEMVSEKEPVIVDKQFHEDCGTGEGYWVITYSDGTTRIE